jgi:hypothetical protein
MRRFQAAAPLAKYLETHIAQLSAEAARIPAVLAEEAAPVLAAQIVELYGHAPPLADLAQSTQDERSALGFSANEPLVRTGGLRDSEEFEALDGVAGAGNPDERSAWMEHGNASRNMPPRAVHLMGLELTIPFAKLEMIAAARELLE